MNIEYHPTSFAWSNYIPIIENIIRSNKLHKILEIGGGANPILSKEFVATLKLDYTVNDISENELLKMDQSFQTQVANFADPSLIIVENYDFIFSKMVMEHVDNIEQFHKNIFQALQAGGFAFHFFPCFNSLPFIINYYLNETITRKLLQLFQKRDPYKNDKFPAYYNWCYGPTQKNIKRFEKLGFRIVEYYGFFGHQYYKNLKILHQLEKIKAQVLLKYPQPNLTVSAFLILQKPA